MKKLNLLKSMLLLCALIVGSNAWAQVSTATATDGKTYVVAYYANSKYYALPHNTSAGVLTGTEVTLNAIDKVNTTTAASLSWTLTEGSTAGQFYLTYTSGNKTYYLFKNGTTSSTNYNIKAKETSDDKHYWEFTSTNSGNTYKVKSLKSTQSTATSIYLGYDGANNAGKFGVYAEEKAAGIILLEIGDAPAYTITALSNNTDMGTVSLSGSVITATPNEGYRVSKTTPYTISSGSATVAQSGNEFTVTPSANTTITINFEAIPALSSIAITTAPTKTTYYEGDTFDATGMVVTATYADESTDDVTALCTWSPSGALATSDTEITVSYTENAVTKTAKQTITVNEYVQPTDVDIDLNNSFFGTSYYGSLSTDQKTALKNGTGYVEGTVDRVNVKFYINTSSNFYINDAQIRAYDKTSLTVTAPSGYVLTDIAFVEPESGKAWDGTHTSLPVGYNGTDKAWSGASSSVTITFGGTCRIVGLDITLSNTVGVTVTSAGYATFVTDCDLDYSGVSGLKAYKASVSGTDITFTKVTTVPAGEGVLLQGDAGDYVVPVTSGVAAWNDNAFVRGTGEKVATDNGDGKYNYILNKVDNEVGFFKANGQTVATNRAYLQTTTSQARINLFFEDGETTGISETTLLNNNEEIKNNNFFDLQGRRVAQPTKGLYIVNGKKVIVK